MEIKENTPDQPMGQRRTQMKFFKISKQMKMKTQHTQIHGVLQKQSDKEIDNVKSVYLENINISNNFTLHLKKLAKEQTKSKINRRKITKIKVEIEEIEIRKQ